jgi:hypothetical protein
MKRLKFDDREFFYMVIEWDEYKGSTYFYDTTVYFAKRKKYWLFGEMINIPYYKELFRLSVNIEDPTFSKDDIREKIAKNISILERLEEIKKGEII